MSTDLLNLRERIAAEARELGFVRIGFAPAGRCETTAVFAHWLACGFHAGMDYLRRQAAVRADPRQLAPWAKSVIVVAARYPSNPEPGSGFSTYARGVDYHEVLKAKLGRLAGSVAEVSGAEQTRVCVDSSPLAEREWAVRAGIGWIGRQGQIVSRESGCCLLLGELLVDIDLGQSEGVPFGCGDCRRCLDACPTGALEADGRVDCRRCISYLTIEHKGEIPEDRRGAMGTALFGCDRCTAVCPWNAHGGDSVLAEFRGRDVPSAEAVLAMSPSEFGERFRAAAVHRTGLVRLQRNAAVALGNAGDPHASAALQHAAAHADPLVRSHAQWALRRLAEKSASPV